MRGLGCSYYPNINTDEHSTYFGNESSLKMAVYGSIFELDRIGDEWGYIGLLLHSKLFINSRKESFVIAVGQCRNILLQSTHAVLYPALN